MRELFNHLGEMEYDGLIAGLVPAVHVSGGVIKGGGGDVILKRGTILAKDGDGKLVVLGTSGSVGTVSATGDGTTKAFSLIADGVIPASVSGLTVGGTAVTTGFIYNAASGELIFDDAPAASAAIVASVTIGSFTPDSILTDDIAVGESDENAAVYDMGCFNANRVIVADGYTLTDEDKEALRVRGIILEAVAE